MTVDLVMKDGDWYLLSDLDSPISFKIVQLGKILSQSKKKGEVIFSYEFPEDTKFPKKKGRKKGSTKIVAKTSKKSPLLEDPLETPELDDPDNTQDQDEREVVERASNEVFDNPDEVEAPKNHGKKVKIQLNPKLKYIDDRKIGQTKSDHQTLARVQPKPDAPTKLRYFKLRCTVHGGDVTVPEWEYNKFREFGHYRCNKCCGGG